MPHSTPSARPRHVHVHLISDATGETLIATARAVAAQYPGARPIEHVTALVRDIAQADRALDKVEEAPGIVLYTLVDRRLSLHVEARCREIGVPCASVLAPILSVYDAYLQMEPQSRAGAQHIMDAGYFRRIEALNFVMAHDDGHLPRDLTQADVVLVGVSRTSKTPTAIYLANRGVKAANVPLVPGLALPEPLATVMRGPEAARPLVVGLVASVEHILQIRRNRLDALGYEEASPKRDTHGFDADGFDADGFDADGFDADGLNLDLLSSDADLDDPYRMEPGDPPSDPGAFTSLGSSLTALPNTARDGVSLAPLQAAGLMAGGSAGGQAHLAVPDYVDRASVAAEIADAKALCARHGWPTIDVTRRSIEETAAAVMALLQERERERERAVSS